MKEHYTNFAENLANTLDDCVALLESELENSRDIEASNERLPRLLQQCGRLISADGAAKEPIRTIHHFACSGGTLISKCLASMPNTLVLSEVEPHSHMDADRIFSPTDLIMLIRSSSRGSSVELDERIFLSALDTIYKDCHQKGLHLILRDHAHSKYCFGDIDCKTPGLLEILKGQHDTLSILTVRHPLDSYLSLENNKWIHFSPTSIEEYSKRYIQFLNDYKELKVFKYEDLIKDSGRFFKAVCKELELSFTPQFERLFGVFQMSGDSGRRSDQIGERTRRGICERLQSELSSSEKYNELCSMLGY